MPKLTKSIIDAIPIPAKKSDGKAQQVIYRDDTLACFGLLVGSGGTKSFFVERRINGRVKRMSLGKYGHLTPAQARTLAQQRLGEIALGVDRHSENRALKTQQITLSEAFEDYLQTRKNLKPGTVSTYRKLMNGCLADWLNKPVISISKDMVEERHSEIGQRAEARANNVMRVLRAIVNHVMAKYEDKNGNPFVTVNPVQRLSQTRAWYHVERRKTYLKPHELKPWYDATQELSQEVARDYLHFVLFTGLRKMEAATLRWENVSFEDDTFTIPDTKNGDPHTLPFSSYLKELLLYRKEKATNEWVFPSSLTDSHLKDPRGSMDYIYEKLGRHVTTHDLRRTFITIAESLDIPAYALKQLINHRDSNDVTAGYIIASVDRLREPMKKIATFIYSHVNPTNREYEE